MRNHLLIAGALVIGLAGFPAASLPPARLTLCCRFLSIAQLLSPSRSSTSSSRSTNISMPTRCRPTRRPPRWPSGRASRGSPRMTAATSRSRNCRTCSPQRTGRRNSSSDYQACRASGTDPGARAVSAGGTLGRVGILEIAHELRAHGLGLAEQIAFRELDAVVDELADISLVLDLLDD